ncbi:MAG: alpha/beta fold hydrolase [Pseudomonadota bacterium]
MYKNKESLSTERVLFQGTHQIGMFCQRIARFGKILISGALGCLSMAALPSAHASVSALEKNFVIPNFRFDDGNEIELRQHYRTLGTLRRDATGRAQNAVLIMHGTTGSGLGFLRDQFAGVLFEEGGILDANRYFIILPDSIGHGGSSKPSDGLRARFPAYTYEDIIRAQHSLLTNHLGVDHLRLVMGTSMGGMLSWMWGVTYPGFMDALMPLASLPVEIAGRNRMLRKMIIDAIKTDPSWNQGEYDRQPDGLREAVNALIVMTSSPLFQQSIAPTRAKAEVLLESLIDRYTDRLDANDMVWAFDASRFYNPAPRLNRIEAPLLAINSADDQVNPPELGILNKQIQHVMNGTGVVLPITGLTRGHGTHSLPSIWGPYLGRFLTLTQSDTYTKKLELLFPRTDDWHREAPASFTARFETSEGSFEVLVDRTWAPRGADRFYNLVSNGFFDGVAFHRVVEGFVAQFGISPDPQVTKAWESLAIKDDPVLASNRRGCLAFANSGPDSRNTQVFINLVDNSRLDQKGFAPFGEVTSGLDVIDRLYAQYGESSGSGMRSGQQAPLKQGGAKYLTTHYPLLDYILDASVVSTGELLSSATPSVARESATLCHAN